MKTDSPYYEWASELIVVMKANFSMTSMRVAEKLEEDLPKWLEELDWCADCEECRESDIEPSEAYLEARGNR